MGQSELSIGSGVDKWTNQRSALGQVTRYGPIRCQLTALSVWIAAEMGPDLQQRQHRRLWSRLIPAHRRGRHRCCPVSLSTLVLGFRMEVEVEDAADRDVLLHLVVPLPVPHDVRLDVVPGWPMQCRLVPQNPAPLAPRPTSRCLCATRRRRAGWSAARS